MATLSTLIFQLKSSVPVASSRTTRFCTVPVMPWKLKGVMTSSSTVPASSGRRATVVPGKVVSAKFAETGSVKATACAAVWAIRAAAAATARAVKRREGAERWGMEDSCQVDVMNMSTL